MKAETIKKRANLYMISLFLLVGNTIIYGADMSDIERQAERNMRNLENTQRLLELKQQQQYINEQLKYPERNKEAKEEDNVLNVEDGKKYLFKDITLVGSKLLKKETEKVLNEYINTEMGKQEIYELLTKLSNIFLTRGFATTMVTIKSGNVNEGWLVYEVKEGKIRDIKMMDTEKQSFRDTARIKFAFPMKKGDMLTTQDMDQGVENMSVGGTRVSTEVTPTEEYGYSDLLIEKSYSPTGFSIGMDDSGYEDIGRNKVNINFSQDNILGINDRLTLNYIERLTKDRDLDKETNYDIGYSVPFGYWKFSYNYNLGDNENTTVTENYLNYKSESKSEKHKIKLSRILSRGQYHKTTAYGGLVYRDNYNTFNGTVLDSSKKYANTLLGIDHTNRFLGGTIFGMLEYERGVPWLSAEGDLPNMKDTDYKREYDKILFNIDWQRMLMVKEHAFQYRMSIGGAYSEDNLLSANKFSIGDEYTVRGFKESSLDGAKGVYVSNTITYMGTRDMNKYLAMFQPFIGLDWGMLKDNEPGKAEYGYSKIAGMAVGVRISAGGFYGGITYGIPLMWADGMKDGGRPKNPFYVNLGYSF